MLYFMSVVHASGQIFSEDFPYESRFVNINGANLHYVEFGEGDPVLFLHGIPLSAYSWRKIIPVVSQSSRAIALDFMGFGKSDKPDINYSFSEQLAYLEAFIESLELNNLTLVMTDIGGIIGLRYAMDHPQKIKGLVFMETPLAPAENFHQTGGMMQRMMFWMAGKPKFGYNMIVKKNMFLKMMPMLMKHKLTAEEKAVYHAPFTTEASRKALYTPPRSFPKKGKNPEANDMADFINSYSEKLQQSELPKLLLYARPGMLVNKKVLKWSEEHLPNLTTTYVGKGKHLMEEDQPQAIGEGIINWLNTLSTTPTVDGQ